MADKLYRAEIVIDVDENQAESRVSKFQKGFERRTAAMNRVRISPAASINDRITSKLNKIQATFERTIGAGQALGRMKVEPLISARDKLTSTVVKAGGLVSRLDLAQATPVIAVQDRVLNEVNKAQLALSSLDAIKASPMAELSGKIFGQLTKASTETKKLDSQTARPEAMLRDRVTSATRAVTSSLRSLTSRTWTVTIAAKDKVTSTVRGITEKLTSPLALLGTGAGVYGIGKLTLGAAMDFETQMVSMEHWLNGNKALATDFTAWLDRLAAATPFEMADLFPAASRAIGVSDGDISVAQRLVKLSADMAGLTPGKTVQDAMEALADAQMGEFERMKEFNMKFSKSQMDAIGGFAGFLMQAEGKFAGGADALSKTAIGRLSTITDTVKTLFRQAGVGALEAMSPRLQKITVWFDKNPATVQKWKDKLTYFGRETFEGMLSSGETFLGRMMNKFEDPGFQRLNWSAKIMSLLEDTSRVVVPRAGEIGVQLGLNFAKGVATGLANAMAESPLLSLVFGMWLGTKVPGPITAKIAVGVATAGVPIALNAGEKVAPYIPGTTEYVTKRIEETTNAYNWIEQTPAGQPMISGGTISAGKESLWDRFKGVFGHAAGGLFSSPHIGLVAEAGPEAVIPLSSRMRSRGLELLQQVGGYFGGYSMTPAFAGGYQSLGRQVSMSPSSFEYVSVGSNQPITTSSGGINVSVSGVSVAVHMPNAEIDEDELALSIGRKIIKPIINCLENKA